MYNDDTSCVVLYSWTSNQNRYYGKVDTSYLILTRVIAIGKNDVTETQFTVCTSSGHFDTQIKEIYFE